MRWSGSAPPGPSRRAENSSWSFVILSSACCSSSWQRRASFIPSSYSASDWSRVRTPSSSLASVSSSRLYSVSKSSEAAPFLEAILFRHLGREAPVLDVHRQPLLAPYLLDAGARPPLL